MFPNIFLQEAAKCNITAQIKCADLLVIDSLIRELYLKLETKEERENLLAKYSALTLRFI